MATVLFGENECSQVEYDNFADAKAAAEGLANLTGISVVAGCRYRNMPSAPWFYVFEDEGSLDELRLHCEHNSEDLECDAIAVCVNPAAAWRKLNSAG